MNISNEDKISLLEFLGYETSTPKQGIPGKRVLSKEELFLATFNPLDIYILFKAVDIIEKKHNTCTDLFFNANISLYIQTIGDYGVDKNYIDMRSEVREEAILKAVLEYIKTTK